jgi:hypothetical protein
VPLSVAESCPELRRYSWATVKRLSLAVALAIALSFSVRRANAANTEFTPVPIVGGDTDLGFGGGLMISLARTGKEYDPYLYRFEAAATTTFKVEPGQGLTTPYQDHYILGVFPYIFGTKIQLQIRASYTREATLKYYGVGNAAPIPAGLELGDPSFEYERIHPTLRVSAIEKLNGPLHLELGLAYTHNWLTVQPGSKLAADRNSDNATVRSLVGSFGEHGVPTFGYGVAFDTRDEQVTTSKGQYHGIRLDWSPGGTRSMPFTFARLSGALREFIPVAGEGSVIALDAPVYELARFDDTGAFGGPNGVRGVPGERYSGKIKLFGNAEFRQNIITFSLLGKKNTLGFALFCDAGRLWATYASHPELDGRGLGLKLGMGGGPRIIAGKSFVIRVDVAWSPDARPIGAYLASGQIF